MTTTIATCGRSCRASTSLRRTIACRDVISTPILWRPGSSPPPGRRSARLELRLGVADDLVAVLLGDGVDERPPVANLLDGAGHDDLLLRKAHPPELNREALEPAGVVAGSRRVRARDLCHPVEAV